MTMRWHSRASQRQPGREGVASGRGRIRGVALVAAAVVALPVTLVGAQPAYAADTMQCAATASVFAAQTDGVLWRYPLNSPGSATSTWSARVSVGSGWGTYGRVLGGPDGRVYGINSTGLYRYRYTGSGWETIDGSQRLQLSTSFTGYAGAAMRDKITVDERGDFYLIDGVGKLRWYRYDEASRTWSIFGRVLETGWDRFDLIVAAGPGVLYTRTPAGALYRHRFEPVSQRWIVRDKVVGTGWNGHAKGLFSVGGDTLFGIQADGDIFQYHYREDNNTWPIMARDIGNGWQQFSNVFATTNTCHLTETHTPARPATPLQNYTPTAVLQVPPAAGQSYGAIDYLHTDNIGRLRHGRQVSADDFSSVQWSVISGDDAFTGKPALLANGQSVVQTLAHKTNSDVWSRTQVAPPSPSWQTALDLGGAMKSTPAAVRLSDNTLAVFAFDAGGALWARPQDDPAGDLLPWRQVSTTAMAGDPVVIASTDRAAILVATDANGTPHTATYRDGALSAWTSLGGTGLTGTPSVVVMPGRLLRVFMRGAAGEVLTQQQDTTGAFPGTWSQVGTLVAAGAPAAILDPALGRVAVVARGTDNEIYQVFETAQGSAQWGDWARLNDGLSDPAATDPTVAPLENSNGQSWVVVFRNASDATRVYDRRLSASAAAMARQARPSVQFVGHTLPTPVR